MLRKLHLLLLCFITATAQDNCVEVILEVSRSFFSSCSSDTDFFKLEEQPFDNLCNQDECSLRFCELQSPDGLLTLNLEGEESQVVFTLSFTDGSPIPLALGKDCEDEQVTCVSCSFVSHFVLDVDHPTLTFEVLSITDSPSKSPTVGPTSSPSTTAIETLKEGSGASDILQLAKMALIPVGCLCLFIVIYVAKTKRQNKKPIPTVEEVQAKLEPKMISCPMISYKNRNGSRDALRKNYISFYKAPAGQQPSALGTLLRNRFTTKEPLVPEHLSYRTEITVSTLRTYKTTIQRDMLERHKKIKTLSTNFPDNFSGINQLLGVGETAKNAGFHESALEMVKKVSEKLKKDILSAAEVEQLNNLTLLDQLPKFSAPPPKIDLQFYLFRLVSGLNKWFHEETANQIVGMRCLLFSLVYLKKIERSVPHFGLTVFNFQRLFGILLLVAAKFTEDEIISNVYWKDVCGISLEEINSLEDSFCFSSEFNFYVTPEELDLICAEYGLNTRINNRESNDLSV